jgi:Tol biopolymer transport system component
MTRERIFSGTVFLSMAIVLAIAAPSCARKAASPSPNGENVLGLFEGHGDVGPVERPGSAAFLARTQEYLLKGSGANMWFGADEFQFLWKRLKGDFILSARIAFIGKGVEAHRKIGWMVRSTLDSAAAHASAVVHGDGLTSLQFRKRPGEDTGEARMAIEAADQIQLERKGDAFVMSAARFGETTLSERISDIALGERIYVGLFVCSHNAKISETAKFSNVRIVIPAPEGFVPYEDYIGSELEILDVESGARKVVYRSPLALQAPNWTADGKALIYNCDGLLYRFDLAAATPAVLDTGFAKANNNDHALSFDGRTLGISSHSPEDGDESIIFTVPAGGGVPFRVTAKGPSYLHGWSPDGQNLVYSGGRNGAFDVYKIAAKGGEEIRLTDAEGLDDGPEYAPDGRTIYFNSNRTGSMKIWRMNPDGSGQEQVSFGPFNDWFPHVSPDGRRIVFLSFGEDVDPGDHPFYRRVYLRMMPAAGGEPRVIAYVYGGQGTINVPSWSPDGRKIAFVGNTDSFRSSKAE